VLLAVRSQGEEDQAGKLGTVADKPYRSPGHQCERGSLADILVVRSAITWLRL
jgi:hypothetical protein